MIFIGITAGDPAGIGPEILVKALSHNEIFEKSTPLVYADRIVLEEALKLTKKDFALNRITNPEEALGKAGTIDYIEAGVITSPGECVYGETGSKAGDAAFKYVLRAINDAVAGKISAVVTCPISKEAINLAGHKFAGHTEIFAHYTGVKNYGMLLSAGSGAQRLNVIHVTTHAALRKACDLITKERVYDTICLAKEALRLMGCKTARIAVAGLNPHCSENGLFGSEEEESIIPAVEKAKAQGFDVTGPVPPDTVFVKALSGRFDMVVAMYHDQGHIPLKLCGFSIGGNGSLRVSGINATIGLPVIRTSVDHGTAFDIAGKNIASEESLLDAINMAVTFAENKLVT